MSTCKDCPISLVCIATGLHISRRKHEQCSVCEKCWISYCLPDGLWRVIEVPMHLAACCTNLAPVTCERCVLTDIEQKHQRDGLRQDVYIDYDENIVSFVPTAMQTQFLFASLAEAGKIMGDYLEDTIANPLETPITNAEVHFVPPFQLTFQYGPTPLDLENFREAIVLATRVPHEYLFPKEKGKP